MPTYKNCNLLGIDIDRAKLQQVKWGRNILQAQQAKKTNAIQAAQKLYQEAEEVYRNIRKHYENNGLFELAGHFFKNEMFCRRMQMPLWSLQRISSKAVDIFSGYGERPFRIVSFSMIFIVTCAFIYF